MPNWSDTEIILEGNKDIIKEIFENINKFGLDWGPFKTPKIFDAYAAPIAEVVSREEWLKFVKQNRSRTKILINVMKKSVRERLISRYGVDNWYDWRINYWGTKWNIYDYKPTLETEEILIWSFASAWSGPDKWFEKLCKIYNLSGEFVDSEPGGDFFVYIKYKKGKKIKDVSTSYISKESVKYYGMDYFTEQFEGELTEEEAEDFYQMLMNASVTEEDKKEVERWRSEDVVIVGGVK